MSVPTTAAAAAAAARAANLSAKATALVVALAGHRGKYAAVTWESAPAVAAAHRPHTVGKRVRATARTGVTYANLSEVADRTTGSLPDWAEWALFPWIIRHKTTGQEYLRVNGETIHAVEWSLDGQPCDKATAHAVLRPSARGGKRPTGGTVTPKVEAVTLG